MLNKQVILQVEKIKKVYETEAGTIQILKGLSTQFYSGEVVSIIGPSGSGKSTLLGILGSLDTPTEGRIIIEQQDITSMSEEKLADFRAKKIGFVFQSYNLVTTMTAQENVMMALMCAGVKNQKEMITKSREMLDLVGMEERYHHLPSQLSGGQQQRVAIARALVNNPTIVIADEPTGNLDSKTGKNILNLIFQLRDQLHMTFIIATHDTHVAKLSNRVLKMEDGLLVQEIFNNHTKSSKQEGGITSCY
ncbi:ABC transporter ATP-binding protein [Bacillus cereus]|uniref:ABC transporter ATP-binding protein n=1 Tax=Bacillus cereus TaxID=1396 RepID=UPI000D97CAFC|nr:ABC transporter ATP-binding protein [Bacillus cereus]PYD94797.1 lipoprotein-releasing system ATP-binding protein LolD [Bacillus cereus]HDR3652498.1 ABC transporter ATP-binding protein [Bacillus anthracis]